MMTLDDMKKVVLTDPETKNLHISDVDIYKVYLYLQDRDQRTTIDGYKPVLKTDPYVEIVYEPTKEKILDDILPRHVCVQVYRMLLESSASEHGARMTAMDSATRNAGEMIEKLTLLANRMRQQSITTELVEIVSGAEAL